MDNDKVIYAAILKQHEGRLQQLRTERKAESRRLDDLKRVLQTKMEMTRSTPSNSNAA